jgi:hypothetical protein
MTIAEKGTEVSNEVLEAVKKGQQVALDAVRTFVEKVNEVVPTSEASTKRQEIIDSAFHMTDRLVAAQYEFIQNVVRASSKSLSSKE